MSSVQRTAAWEWVWMQAPAPRLVKAARKRGVQAEGLRERGRRMYVWVG